MGRPRIMASAIVPGPAYLNTIGCKLEKPLISRTQYIQHNKYITYVIWTLQFS